MNATEMISKFGLVLAPSHGPDTIKVVGSKKPSTKEAEELKANKPAILELLRARQAEQEECAAKARAITQERFARELAEFEAAKAEQLPALLAQIPEGAIRLTVTAADFDRNMDIYHAGERKIFHTDVTYIGTVWSGQYREVVAFISAIRLAELEGESAQKVEVAADKKAATEEKRHEAFSTAKATGVRVALGSYTTSCSDPREECSLDIVTEYAMPDGTTSTSRTHTW